VSFKNYSIINFNLKNCYLKKYKSNFTSLLKFPNHHWTNYNSELRINLCYNFLLAAAQSCNLLLNAARICTFMDIYKFLEKLGQSCERWEVHSMNLCATLHQLNLLKRSFSVIQKLTTSLHKTLITFYGESHTEYIYIYTENIYIYHTYAKQPLVVRN